MTDGRARVVAAGAAAVIALAYLLPFRAYGLNLDDEGALLYQIQRVVAGEVPYVDFTTGYTPGFFYLGAAAWRLAGDLPTFRLLLALLHAATVAGLVLLAARVATPILALTVALLLLVFIPVYPGEFCAFNTPYPAWVATAAWVGMALALTTFVVRRRRAWLMAAGLAAAAAFAIKPNAGVFAIAAAATVLLMLTTPADDGRAGSALVWYALWAGILGGSWATFGFRPYLRDAVAFLFLPTAAMLALPTRARTHRSALVGDVAVLLGSFVAATLPWAAFFWARLGIEGILRDVLLLGSGAAALYYKPYPPFEPWALLVTALVGAAALAGAGMRAGWLRPSWVAVGAVAGVLASALAVTRLGLMPERTLWSVIWQLESAGFPLTLATQAAGVVWLWRCRVGNGCELPATLLLCGLFMHLQLYPRPDFMHLVAAAPLTATFAAFLLERVLAWWSGGLRRAGAPGLARAALPAAIAVLVLVSILRVSPSFAALQGPRVRLPFPKAPIGVEAARAADIEAVGAAATRLATEVPPGSSSLAFPAADVVLFLAGGRNPTPYAYFFPGRPDHREEAEVVDALAAAPPRALVSLNRGLTFFDEAPSYYFLLRRFARARYGLLERDGRFDVLGLGAGRPAPTTIEDRRDRPIGAAREPALLADLAAQPFADAAPALLELATGDDVVVRRAALTTIAERLAAAPDRGLEEYVAAAGLDRRREVLLLRTIRDLREARAASYLFAAAARPDARVADEALGAMYVLRSELIARRHLWAGAEFPAVWPGRDALGRAVRVALGDPAAPPRATALAAHLAGELGDRDAAPLLRARLGAAEAAVAASAADALATLVPGDVACELTPLLARPELETVALVPSVLLRLAEEEEPVRSAARTCLGQALAAPGATREPAIWIAAALGDERFAPALRTALTADAAGVRRAAAWALGELPAAAANAAGLARAATGDVDGVVRRLATRAAAKQEGHAPRAGDARRDAAKFGSRG